MLRILLTLALILPSFATAEKLATAVVNGRKVNVYSDKTWAYQDQLQSSCTSLDAHVSFCSNDTWRKALKSSADQLAQYTNDKDQYGIIVSEGLGLADGVSLEFMVDAALSNAAIAWGLNKSDIPVLEISDVEFEGMQSRRLSVSAEIQAVSLILIYTISVADGQSYQLITFRVGKNYGSTDEALHQSFIKHVEIQ
jgi:hypothetical protein